MLVPFSRASRALSVVVGWITMKAWGIWVFPKMRGSFLVVPIMKIIVCWALRGL